MPKYNIPEVLMPYDCGGLVRLGRDFDGGYVVNQQDVEKAKGLLSFGVSYDWSFEKDFTAINDVPLVAYDGSVTLDQIWKHYWKNILRVDRFDLMREAWYGIFFLRAFFDGKKRHFESRFVGSETKDVYIGFDAVVRKAPFDEFFLKMDVEGSEYEMLDLLLDFAPRTIGLAIEFHEVGENLEKIIEFVSRYPLTLVHTHINNCAPPIEKNLPQLVELSFSRTQTRGQKVNQLPHKLDMSNSPKLALPEICCV